MKRFAKLLLVTLGFGALGFVVSLVPQKNATGAGAAPVSVVNTSANPVPVTGTVAVSRLPSVTLGGSVTVGNTSANPVLTQSVGTLAANAFFKSGTCTFAVGALFCSTYPAHMLSVPAGQTAVITYASGNCSPDAGSGPFSASLNVSGNAVDIVPTSAGTNGQIQFGRQLELYLPGSATTTVDPQVVASSGQAGGETCNFVLSGYFAANGATS